MCIGFLQEFYKGGPHENQIAATAVALLEANTPEFKAYAVQVKKNAGALAKSLISRGYTIQTNGTDNHLALWDLRPQGITGNKIEKATDAASITVNKNSIYGDTSALTPGGVRLGTPALTSRGFVEKDFERVAEYLDRAVKISIDIQAKSGKKLVDFEKGVKESSELKKLSEEVEKYSSGFPMPG